MSKVSVYCPFCHKHTSLEPALTDAQDSFGRTVQLLAITEGPGYDERWWIGTCNFCQRPMLVLNSGDRVYPTPIPAPSSEHIPDEIRSDLDEAKQCCSISAWRACAVMARRAIQSAALAKGGTGRQLHEQIQDLATKNVITADLREWADVVRWVGNDGAHPGGDTVSRADAEDILNLCQEFLHTLFVTPAVAQARRKARGK